MSFIDNFFVFECLIASACLILFIKILNVAFFLLLELLEIEFKCSDREPDLKNFCQCQSSCMQNSFKKCTPLMTTVIKVFLPNNLRSREDGTSVVVVNGFILNPSQVFRLFLAVLYFIVAFLLIVARNSFINEENSISSACFTGGLSHNRSYKTCVIFYENNTSSEISSKNCTHLDCGDCPKELSTILCLESTPNIIPAIAGLVGLVKITQLILSAFASIMFYFAGKIRKIPIRQIVAWVIIFILVFILVLVAFFIGLGYIIYHYVSANKSASTKAAFYIFEWIMYMTGLCLVMVAIPWYSAARYHEHKETLCEEYIDDNPPAPQLSNGHHELTMQHQDYTQLAKD